MALRPFTLDAWSPLSHKQAVGDGTHPTVTMAPTWVPESQRRRLDAYRVLAALLANSSRCFPAGNKTATEQAELREYGDAALLRDRCVGAVLGETWELVVDGADTDLPDEPQLPAEPPAVDTATGPIQRRVLAARRARWELEAEAALVAWEEAWAEQPALRARQEWIRQWADDEQLPSKLVEGEGDTVGLGDGVFTLAWSEAKQRAVVEVYDPGMYFPVLADKNTDYPTRVHIAWEFEDDTPDRRRWVRRLTWELGPIEPVVGDEGVGPAAGDTVGPDGRTSRAYPWNVDEGGTPVPSDVTCWFSDGTWPFEELAARKPDDFDAGKATWAETDGGQVARHLDLRLDFLPVVHIPNTPAHREHFGTSVLALVAQVLDDLMSSDTDVQAAQALAAGPVISLAGGNPADEVDVRPGSVFKIPKEGRMDVLDLSVSLPEIRASRQDLLDRLSVNARVPAEVLGRVKASEVPSGVALALSFSPFTQLIGTMRMTRDPKYRLLLKFAQRLAIGAGVLEPGPALMARIAFGSYLPSDSTALIDMVVKLLAAGAISTQTAIGLLVDGGVDIEDARGEVQRVRFETPSKAKDIADATGSERVAADWLGVELPEAPAVEPVTVTPVVPPVIEVTGGQE